MSDLETIFKELLNSPYNVKAVMDKQTIVNVGEIKGDTVIINDLPYELGNTELVPKDKTEGVFILYNQKAYYIKGDISTVDKEVEKSVTLKCPEVKIEGKTTLENKGVDVINSLKEFSEVGKTLTPGSPVQNAAYITELKIALLKLSTSLSNYLN